jgi:hypothetical protein
MREMTMTKLLVKYTKYTEYEVPIESNNDRFMQRTT